jgi:hypothetical protein
VTEQDCAQRISTAAKIAQTGQLPEAARLCREVLATNPTYVPALLWLVFSSSDAFETSQALNQANQLEPANPLVVQAVNWNKQRYIQPESLRPSPSQLEPEQAVVPQPTSRPKFTPLAEPVKDSSFFFLARAAVCW